MTAHFLIQTPRLVLRELVVDDLDFVAAMLGDPEVMRYYPKPLSRVEAKGWLDRQRARYATEGHGLWLTLERETRRPVGQVGLVMQDVSEVGTTPTPEVGYLLAHSAWGRGYATEAALAVRQHAFETLSYPRVIALIRPENTRSQGVALRLGMRILAETTYVGFAHRVYGVEAAAIA
jgi:Acetyltransferases, including N-acetylases of ribosomal proteins